MELLKAANLALAFFIELAMIAAYGYWGFTLDNSLAIRIAAGIGLPVIVIAIWSRWFAPRAKTRLIQPWLLIAKIGIFAIAVGLLYQTSRPALGTILAVATGVNFVLATLWKQDTSK